MSTRPPSTTLRILARHWPRLAIIVPLALCETALEGGLTVSYKFLIDAAIVPQNGRMLGLILLALAGGFALAAAFSFLRDYVYARVVTGVVNELRARLFAHSGQLSVAFHHGRQSSEVLTRFATDVSVLEATLLSAINSVLLPALSIAMGIGLLFYFLEWQVACVAAAGWSLVLLGPRLIAPRAAAAAYEKKENERVLLARVDEAVAAHTLVKAYGLGPALQQRFTVTLATLARRMVRAFFLGSLVERTTVVCIYGIQIAAVAVGAWLAYEKHITTGSFIAFLTVFWNLGWSVVVLARSAPSVLSAHASTRAIDELLATAPDPLERPTGRTVAPLREAIRFEAVRFGYATRPGVLNGVSFEVRRGQYVAIVGPSGCGKSSLMQLLARFYEPESGRILVDGEDVRAFDAGSLRALFGVVLQDSVLFDLSLRENIRLGRPDASDAEVEAAAHAAEIDATIRTLPLGYDTLAGRAGALLSGGQRQRVAIARAMIRNPAVLLLDEATSALDPATEASVHQTLVRAGRGRTTLAVTHRLALVTNADAIVVLQNGTVAETGRHEELVARGGVYAELWRRQHGIEVSDGGFSARVTGARLHDIPLFSSLTVEQLRQLAGRFVSMKVPAGQVLFREGDPGDLFYLVARGTVAITRLGADGAAREIARLGDGDELGEIALLRATVRNATATARTDVLALTLTREYFDELLEAHPGLRQSIEKKAAARS